MEYAYYLASAYRHMECAYYLASFYGIGVTRVARTNLANSNLASKNNSKRQICGGPRLGWERLRFLASDCGLKSGAAVLAERVIFDVKLDVARIPLTARFTNSTQVTRE